MTKFDPVYAQISVETGKMFWPIPDYYRKSGQPVMRGVFDDPSTQFHLDLKHAVEDQVVRELDKMRIEESW